MKIIGISGTNGSGKDTVGDLLAERYNFLFVSVTEMLRDELRRRKLPINRVQTSKLSAEWRRDFGHGVLVQKAIEHYKNQTQTYAGLVVASLRHPSEVEVVHESGGQVIWIDAEPRVRYDRIQKNAHLRNRAGEDNTTFEKFLDDEKREMKPEGDKATLDMGSVKQKADIFIENNGNDVKAFQKAAEKALEKYLT